MTIVRITRRGNASGIVVPRAYMRELGWIQGEHVCMAIQDGVLVVERMTQQPKIPRLAGRRRERAADARA
jgi:antitoxin component of MazEF toxin-antitoxin module